MTQIRTATRALGAVLLASSLAACSILGSNERDRATIYAPDPRVAMDPSWPHVDWQLTLAPPTAPRVFDSFRIAVRPTPGELQVYRGAAWAKRPTDMVEDVLLRTFEDSGRITGVARQGVGVAGDYRLVIDLRRFEAEYAGGAVPAATIELNAKMLHIVDGDVLASRTFRQAVPATGAGVTEVSEAFSQGLGAMAGEIAGWVLSTGQAHEQVPHPLPD